MYMYEDVFTNELHCIPFALMHGPVSSESRVRISKLQSLNIVVSKQSVSHSM